MNKLIYDNLNLRQLFESVVFVEKHAEITAVYPLLVRQAERKLFSRNTFQHHRPAESCYCAENCVIPLPQFHWRGIPLRRRGVRRTGWPTPHTPQHPQFYEPRLQPQTQTIRP